MNTINLNEDETKELAQIMKDIFVYFFDCYDKQKKFEFDVEQYTLNIQSPIVKYMFESNLAYIFIFPEFYKKFVECMNEYKQSYEENILIDDINYLYDHHEVFSQNSSDHVFSEIIKSITTLEDMILYFKELLIIIKDEIESYTDDVNNVNSLIYIICKQDKKLFISVSKIYKLILIMIRKICLHCDNSIQQRDKFLKELQETKLLHESEDKEAFIECYNETVINVSNNKQKENSDNEDFNEEINNE